MAPLRNRGHQRQGGTLPHHDPSGYIRQTEHETTPCISPNVITTVLTLAAMACDATDQARYDDSSDPHDASMSSRFAFGSLFLGICAFFNSTSSTNKEFKKAAVERSAIKTTMKDGFKKAADERSAMKDGLNNLVKEMKRMNLMSEKRSLETEKTSLEIEKQSLEDRMQAKGNQDNSAWLHFQMSLVDRDIARVDRHIAATETEFNELTIAINTDNDPVIDGN